MRIGINALSVTNRSGTGYYTQELILALCELDPTNEYFLFLPEACLLSGGRRQKETAEAEAFGRRLRPALRRAANFQSLLVSPRNRLGRVAWEQYYLPREARRLRLDLLHSPTGAAPARLRCPSVVTLHDLAFHHYPRLFSWLHRRYLRRVLPPSARRAAAVLTDSETCRNEMVAQLGLSPEKVFAVPLGVAEVFRPMEEADRLERLRQAYRLPRRFILALGTVEPRKNLLTLVDAFEELSRKNSDLGLVLVGRRGWQEEPVFEKIESLRLPERIRWLGFVPREDLPALYTLATVCAYLSFYEGFGLPVLEAMACGTPVVASDIAVFREWTQGAALLVPPDEPSPVAEALLRAADSGQERERLRQAGLALASQLTWQRTARATLEVYQRIGTGR